MLSNNQIKHIKSLHQRKYRKQHDLFIVEGDKLVEELVQSDFEIEAVYATIDWNPLCDYVEISNKDLERITAFKTPNKVLAVVKQKPFSENSVNLNGKLSLVLDNINDPGNLGTIIRTGLWFGIENFILSEKCVELYNPKVVQSSMGGIFKANIVYTNLKDFLASSTLPSFGAYLGGKDIYKMDKPVEGLIVMGSESHGISGELESLIVNKITIPGSGKMESLNVGIACGIICSELSK